MTSIHNLPNCVNCGNMWWICSSWKEPNSEGRYCAKDCWYYQKLEASELVEEDERRNRYEEMMNKNQSDV